MSEGPIKHERRGHVAPTATTAAKDRICADGTGLHATVGRAYCGRSSTKRTPSWDDVTCSECRAARRADEEAAR